MICTMAKSTTWNYYDIVAFRLRFKRYIHRTLTWILLFCFSDCLYVKGAVMISPSGIASTCSGEQLDITCTTNGTFIRWYIRPESENDASRTFTRTISSLIVVTTVAPLMINTSTFSFSRVSTRGSLPLTSRLVISPVSENVNETEVICEDVTAMVNSSTTIVNVITSGSDPSNVRDSKVELSYSEHFYKDNVTINLNYSHENSLVLFNITVVSQLSATIIGNLHTPVPIPLFYNMQYNISVVASLCGQAIATNSVGLSYESCEDPNTSGESLIITGYMIPAREGTNITLHCSPWLEHIGPNTSTCMGNGKWEPDLTEVECRNVPSVIKEDVTVSGSRLTVNTVAILIPFILGIITIIVACIIGSVILLTRKGIIKCSERKRRENREIELCSIPNESSPDDQIQSGTLVYADLGSSLFKQLAPTTSAIDLDDSHVEYAIINHTEYQRPHTLSEQNPEAAGEIPSVNLDNLLILIKAQVIPMWRKFGETVKIDKNVLDNFAKNCSPEECIVEMLDYWLRNCTNQPTWNDVAKTLNSIGLQQLAFEIDEISTTGNLPIEADIAIKKSIPLTTVTIFESPPPIPLKMEKKDHLQEKSFSNEASAPALPPKPWSNTMTSKMPTIPPRPPKP